MAVTILCLNKNILEHSLHDENNLIKMVSVFKEGNETIYSCGGVLVNNIDGQSYGYGFHKNITRGELKELVQKGGGIKEIER